MLISHSFESVLAQCRAGETHRKILTFANLNNLDPTFNCLASLMDMVEIKLLFGFKIILSKFCKTAATLRVGITSELWKKHTSRLTNCCLLKM